MRSAIFRGWVKHCRYMPLKHEFKYSVAMYYLSIKELEQITQECKIISLNKLNLLSFNRKSYIAPHNLSIADAVRLKITSQGFNYQGDNVYLLTNLSYLGYCYNPVTFYYCYDTDDKNLEYIVAEINNTPWDERFCYVMQCAAGQEKFDFALTKNFHISPFMPMDLNYSWYINKPNDKVNIHMQSFKEQQLYFDATLFMQQRPLTNWTSIVEFMRFPLMTWKIISAIYWQALKLWLRRCTFYPHPRRTNES